jgi:DNA transformation protein
MGELSKLINIGKEIERQLNEVGIKSIEELKKIGSREAWIKIQHIDSSACYNRLCGLEGAIQNIRWHNLSDKDKKELRKFYNEWSINNITENKILIDPNIYPEKDILEKALSNKYKFYKTFMDKIKEENLTEEWNYYKDGKSWLCKILNKKKTICWLSIWNIGIKLSFYFTEKTINGINDLEINDEIKEIAKEAESIGKLLPIIFVIDDNKKINDATKIIKYKMKLK